MLAGYSFCLQCFVILSWNGYKLSFVSLYPLCLFSFIFALLFSFPSFFAFPAHESLFYLFLFLRPSLSPFSWPAFSLFSSSNSLSSSFLTNLSLTCPFSFLWSSLACKDSSPSVHLYFFLTYLSLFIPY